MLCDADWNRAERCEGTIHAALYAAHCGATRRASATEVESTSRADVLVEAAPERAEVWPPHGVAVRDLRNAEGEVADPLPYLLPIRLVVEEEEQDAVRPATTWLEAGNRDVELRLAGWRDEGRRGQPEEPCGTLAGAGWSVP